MPLRNSGDRPWHVLVINHRDPALRRIPGLLAVKGIRVSSHRSQRYKRLRLEQISPDLIVLDFQWDNAEHAYLLPHVLRLDSVTAGIPLVVCTEAGPHVKAIRPGLLTRGVEIVFKPIELDIVLPVIARGLGVDDQVTGADHDAEALVDHDDVNPNPLNPDAAPVTHILDRSHRSKHYVWKPADLTWIQQRYLDDGWSLQRIGNALGCSPGTVQSRLEHLGVPLRPNGAMRRPSEVDDSWLRQRYLQDRWTLTQLAEELQRTPRSVRRMLRDAGIAIRPRGRHTKAEVDDSWLRQRYLQDDWSLSQLAEELRCSTVTAHRMLVEAGIEIRPRGRRTNE